MTLENIENRLRVTDIMMQNLENVCNQNKLDCDTEYVIEKVKSFLDDLNWELVVQGEKYNSDLRTRRAQEAAKISGLGDLVSNSTDSKNAIHIEQYD